MPLANLLGQWVRRPEVFVSGFDDVTPLHSDRVAAAIAELVVHRGSGAVGHGAAGGGRFAVARELIETAEFETVKNRQGQSSDYDPPPFER